MSSFTEAAVAPAPDLPKRGGRPVFRVTQPGGFYYDIGFEGSGLRILVPEGFVSDGPSIPVLLARLLPKGSRTAMIKSAMVHDLLREDLRFTKLEGDAIFYMAMQAENTPETLRELAFLAVRKNESRAGAK